MNKRVRVYGSIRYFGRDSLFGALAIGVVIITKRTRSYPYYAIKPPAILAASNLGFNESRRTVPDRRRAI
jgi:hypothetical protein